MNLSQMATNDLDTRLAMVDSRHGLVGTYRSRRGRRLSDNILRNSWRGDGVKPATTRQQTRYAARCAGVVTGRTVAVVVKEREEAEALWKNLAARFKEHVGS